MKVINTDGKNKDFIELCKLLDENLNEIVGGEKQREQYNQYNKLDDIKDVVLIYFENKPIGCGSFKKFENDIAEVKRVFVMKEFRGKGLSKLIMSSLEEIAIKQGYSRLILETGKLLIEAIGLYTKSGYKIIENYGQYKNLNESVCMEKIIGE